MLDEKRRQMLTAGCSVIGLGVLAGWGARALATEQMKQHHGTRGVAAVVTDASEQGVCATCRFWGGMRRVSEDKQSVYSESLGWCNNPASHHYQTTTTPVTGPMKSWQKWEAI